MQFWISVLERIDYLLHTTAWWVYLVFLYCLIIGWKSLYPRVISYYRLFAVPLLLGFWWIHVTYSRYDLTFSHVSTSVLAGLAGNFIGWKVYRRARIEADKRKKLIKLPGTKSTLVSIALIFFFRYYFGYYQVVNQSNLINPFFIYSDLIISALIVGFIVGRGFYYLNAYRTAPHANLSKNTARH